MSKLKKFKFKKSILFSVTIFFIIFCILIITYLNFKIIQIKYIAYDFKIKEQKTLGFNAGTDALHFGIIAPGSAGVREIELTTEKRAKILINVIGHDFIYPNKNSFILEPGNEVLVQFTARPPNDYPKGNYTGKVRIIFKRA
ncbi:MAG: hypothetical protein Q8R00_01535 [Candidatus Nanoarchaeia archaeon]|nr:hypothetical protein [Candidatus Nanoarchaeia archaeon]